MKRTFRLVALCLITLLSASCDDPEPPAPDATVEKSNGPAKPSEPTDAELNRIAELFRENRELSTDPDANRERIMAVEKEGNEIISRITGLDPEANRDDFNREGAHLFKMATWRFAKDLYMEVFFEGDKGFAEFKISVIRRELEAFKARHDRYPTTEEGLTAVQKEGKMTVDTYIDPWNHAFVYRRDGEDYTILSVGPDGIAGNDDDVPKP